MNINVPPPAGAVPWEEVRTRLDQNGPFANMYDTPLYRDAVWEQFSEKEYARRYAAATTDPANAHLTFIRLTSRRDASRFLADPLLYAHPGA